MGVALLVSRVVLALVFGVAGLAKLADRDGTRAALADFGVPTKLAPSLGIVLPLAELVVAGTLLPTATARWGALGALALLLLFVAGIGLNLAKGRRPDCHCFGQLHSSPVGSAAVARNGAFAAVAGFVVLQGYDDSGHSLGALFADLTNAQLLGVVAGLLALALLATGGWLIVNLLRQHGRLLARLDALEASLEAAGIAPVASTPAEPETGLPIGSPAPAFQLSGLHGETLTLDALRSAGKRVLLIFSDPDCGPCNALLPEVGAWQRDHSPHLMISVVSRGNVEANRAKSAEHGLFNVLIQQDREVADEYEAGGTPSAVVVNPDGTIGSSVAAGPDAIRALIGRAVGTQAPAPDAPEAVPALPAGSNGKGDAAAVAAPPSSPPAKKIGERAPRLKLRDLSGRMINLAGMRGSKTLVVFWDPACGFCSQMLDELKAWEAEPPAGAPKLLVVSTGTVEENRAMGLRSPVVVDSNFEVGRAFGAAGTPSAVLVDEKGRIGSDIAPGAEGVLALAGAERNPDRGPGGPVAVNVGEPAPPVELPNLAGDTIDLTDFRGKETLVLFWNPGCGFCQRMLDDLKAWETDRPAGAPELLVVSTGTVEANEAQGLRSPVLLDQTFSVASSFGANGTPMAAVVDVDGRVASEIVAGADAVMELAAGGSRAARA